MIKFRSKEGILKNLVLKSLLDSIMYRPSEIADYYLSNYGQDHDISPMKLIKLVYISHGWYLGLTEKALIDENPEAWMYGPVIPSLYHTYKDFRNNPIKIKFDDRKKFTDSNINEFLDFIWASYGNYSAVELSARTHEIDTPWSQVWNSIKDGNYLSLQIPETSIRDYYRAKVLLAKDSAPKSETVPG